MKKRNPVAPWKGSQASGRPRACTRPGGLGEKAYWGSVSRMLGWGQGIGTR